MSFLRSKIGVTNDMTKSYDTAKYLIYLSIAKTFTFSGYKLQLCNRRESMIKLNYKVIILIRGANDVKVFSKNI